MNDNDTNTQETADQSAAPTAPTKPKRARPKAPKAVKKAEAAAVQVKPPVTKPALKRRPPRSPEMIKALAPGYVKSMQEPQQVTGNKVTVELQDRHYNWLERVAAKEGRSLPNMLDRLVRLAYAADPYAGQQPDPNARSFSGRASDLKR